MPNAPMQTDFAKCLEKIVAAQLRELPAACGGEFLVGATQGTRECLGKTRAEIFEHRRAVWQRLQPLMERAASGEDVPMYNYHLGYDLGVEEVTLRVKWLSWEQEAPRKSP